MTDTLRHLGETPTVNSDKPKQSLRVTQFILPLMIIVVAVVAGRFAAKFSARGASNLPQVTYTQENSLSQNQFGQKNEKLCPDKVEGTMKKGGVEGEGTHHLIRKGGASQNVYLTSSTVDLSQVVNKKVQVWGKTYGAQTAGWLMDVCYLEVE